MDVRKVNEVNGYDIFLDMYTHRYFYWDNGKKRTSYYCQNLINRLKKKTK